jgi:hypothetical protein
MAGYYSMMGLAGTCLRNSMRRNGRIGKGLMWGRLALQEEKNAIEQKLIAVPKLQKRLKELLELKREEEGCRSQGIRRSLSGRSIGSKGNLKSVKSSRW